MTGEDALLLADLIRTTRVGWHAGLVRKPAGADEARLASLERRLRAVANVGRSGPVRGADAAGWVTLAEAERVTGTPRRTLAGWLATGRLRGRKVGDGRQPWLIDLDHLIESLEDR